MHLEISLQKPLLMVFVVILVLSFAPITHSYADGIRRSTIELEAIETKLLASNEEWIAFIGSDNNVWLVHPDGSGLTQITSDASSTIIYSNLKWAQDGRKLAYARVDISAGLPIAQIVILDMDSLLPTTVVENSYGGFDWFEGRTKLIYDKPIDPGEYPTMDYDWGKYDGLWAFSFDTGNSELVVAPYENNPLVNPRVSPDSSYILFDLLTLMGEGPWKNLGVYYRSELLDTKITELSFATCDWSPDGNKIACNNCTPYFCHPEIVLLDRNGIIYNRTATEEDVWIDNLIWSPDGKYIAYGITTTAPYAEGESSVNLITANLSTSTHLTKGTPLDWSPNGSELLVLDNGIIFIVNIVDGERTGIAEGKQAAWQLNTKPAISIELDINPGKEAGQSNLSWTIKCHDKVSCPKIESYDIRYSKNPINKGNWGKARELFGRRINANAFNTQDGITTPVLDTYKKLYFALRATDSNGFESGLSNVVWIIDTGFRPLVNGYVFSNKDEEWDLYPIDQDFTMNDVVMTFGEDKACKSNNNPDNACELRLPYLAWYKTAPSFSTYAGHCVGMASTSLQFHKYPNALLSILPGIDHLYDENVILAGDDIRRIIVYNQVMQLTNKIYRHRLEQRITSTPNRTLQEIESSMLNQSPMILVMDQGSVNSHSVTPLAISNNDSDITMLWIYDNLAPGERRGIRINQAANQWEYRDLTAKDWLRRTIYFHGDQWTHSIYAIPLKYFYDEKTLPNLVDLALFVQGNVNLLIFDKLGRHVGWEQDSFVNEIPGADIVPIIDRGDTFQHPIYSLPVDYAYNLEILSEETDDGGFSLNMLGPDFSVLIENPYIGLHDQNNITVSNDGTQLSYSTNKATEIMITHVVQGDEVSSKSTLSGIDISAEARVFVITDLESGQLVLNNSGSKKGTYSVAIEVITFEGTRAFSHHDVEISSSETHTYDLESFSREDDISLGIDRDNDGLNDEIIFLENQVERSQDEVLSGDSIAFVLIGGIFIVFTALIGAYLVVRKKKIDDDL